MCLEQIRASLSTLTLVREGQPDADWAGRKPSDRLRLMRAFATSEAGRSSEDVAGGTAVSIQLVSDHRTVGSLHVRFRAPAILSGTEIQAIRDCCRSVEREMAALARSADVGLTKREREVLNLLASGASNSEISSLLAVSRHTVSTHLESIFMKLEATNRVQVVRNALRRGLIDECP
ncbi:helix-turn-helix transcriptional regulator [Plantibacter sp. VKM Ac-2885]|nr:helix-turn-helix transcriptional regulator [Plantibacter sp. VKM Ac-2885]